jgi:hypothetical protein
MHCSVARDQEGSIAHCKKEGNWFEVGQIKQCKQGRRNDLEAFKAAVEAGERDPKRLRSEHSKIAAMYPRFFNDYIHDHHAKRTFTDHDKRAWQIELTDILNGEPDGRKIIFVVDETGNTGKTWFCHRYASEHETPDRIQIIPPGKKADMAFALISDPKVVFFDCPRSKQGEFIQYDFLEEVKNGFVFSGKYESIESRNKSFDPFL